MFEHKLLYSLVQNDVCGTYLLHAISTHVGPKQEKQSVWADRCIELVGPKQEKWSAWFDKFMEVVGPKQEKWLAWSDKFMEVVGPKQE